MEITVDQLDKLVKRDKAEEYAKWINLTIERFGITTDAQACHFISQILHESGNLKYVEEIASGEAYEGRKDLGNTSKGDGVKYKGRGLIQITGKFNYQKLKDALFIDFVNHPELLTEPSWATMSAGWYWQTRGLNKIVASFPEQEAIVRITKKINGGLNGLQDRKDKFNLVKSVLT